MRAVVLVGPNYCMLYFGETLQRLETMSKNSEATATKASVTVLDSPKQTVSPSRFRSRHFALLVSFVLCVVAPTVLAIIYFTLVASPQYSSRVSFSIRSEQLQNPLDALSSLGQLSTGVSSDASILNEYLRSQKLIEDISTRVDLRDVYSRTDVDPIFRFDPNKPLEDLVQYFRRMNYVTFDASNGLLDIEVFAFSPDDAQAVATAIMDASRQLVERLSEIAQEDTTRNAKFELERARTRLEETRIALRDLRGREQIVDPRQDLESQMGVLTALQSQLASSLVDYDLLVATTRDSDPRVLSVQRTIDAIKRRIEEERNKVGQATLTENKSLATVVGDFESLLADREFAENAYSAAQATYDTALAEARRKSKYLAAHIPPTRAESSQYPDVLLWVGCIFGLTLLVWSVGALTGYAMLDRR